MFRLNRVPWWRGGGEGDALQKLLHLRGGPAHVGTLDAAVVKLRWRVVIPLDRLSGTLLKSTIITI